MPATKGNEYKQVSFNIEKGLLKNLLLCMEFEKVHSQSEALRLAVREWVKGVIERADKKELMKRVEELEKDNELYRKMYLQEQTLNGAIKKNFHKTLKKEVKEESLEDQILK